MTRIVKSVPLTGLAMSSDPAGGCRAAFPMRFHEPETCSPPLRGRLPEQFRRGMRDAALEGSE